MTPQIAVLLALGNKYIPQTNFSAGFLAKQVAAFTRKVRLRHWAFFITDREKKQPILPSSKLPSQFDPMVPPMVAGVINRWQKSLVDKAYTHAKTVAPPQNSRIIRIAMNQLKTLHKQHKVCKIEGDKGYGPVIVHHHFIANQEQLEWNGNSFGPIDLKRIVTDIMDSAESLNWYFNRAVSFGIINRETHKYIMEPFIRLQQLSNPELDSTVLKALGRIRYLIKLHRPGMKLRRIEYDTRSPFLNVSSWLASTLTRIESKCKHVTTDSKSVLSSLHHFPLELSDAVVMIIADVVDYFPSINIEDLKKSLAAMVAEVFGENMSGHPRDHSCISHL